MVTKRPARRMAETIVTSRGDRDAPCRRSCAHGLIVALRAIADLAWAGGSGRRCATMCYMGEPDRTLARVGVRELRENLSVYLDRVKAGETLVVTEHGEPVARLAPPPPLSPYE